MGQPRTDREHAERTRDAREEDELAHDEVAAEELAAPDANRAETAPGAEVSSQRTEAETAAIDARVHEAESRLDGLRVLSRFCGFSSTVILSLAVPTSVAWLERLAQRLYSPRFELDIFHAIHDRLLLPLVDYKMSTAIVNFGVMLVLLMPISLLATWQLDRRLVRSLDVLERATTPSARAAIDRLMHASVRSRFLNPMYLARITRSYRRMTRTPDPTPRDGSLKARNLAGDLGALAITIALAAGFALWPAESTLAIPRELAPFLVALYYVAIGYVGYRIFKRVEMGGVQRRLEAHAIRRAPH